MLSTLIPAGAVFNCLVWRVWVMSSRVLGSVYHNHFPNSNPSLANRLLDEACTDDDLATVTERAKACARKWENIV